MLMEGTIAFSNVTEPDVYMNQSTGKYSVTVTMTPSVADTLQKKGIKVKTYTPEEGEPLLQRRFSSKFGVSVIDADDNPVTGEIPRGSLVRVKYELGIEHPVHGVSTYVKAVRVLEFADAVPGGNDPEDEGF